MAKNLTPIQKEIMEFQAASLKKGREQKARRDIKQIIDFQKTQEENLKKLSKKFFKKDPTTKSRGKKLKVSADAGARGLFDLL